MNKFKTFSILTGIFLGSFLFAQAATVFYSNQVGNSQSNGYVLQTNGNNVSTWVATSTLGISGSPFAWTPQSWGNSTSTTLGFLNGFISASSTFSNILRGRESIFSSYVDASYFVATSSTATSTFAGGMTWGNLMFYEGATGRLAFGASEFDQTINGSAISSLLTTHTEGTGTQGDVSMHRHSSTATRGATLYGTRSRGTEASETVVQTDDNLFDFIASGFDGTDYENSSRIDMEVDNTVSANIIPGRIKFLTSNTSGSMTEAMRVDSSQRVGVGTTSPGTLFSIGNTGWNFVDGATATTTASGHLYVKGNLQVDGRFFAPVTLVTSGNTTINGALTVTGATTLATSLTGAVSASSGVISAGTLTVANGGTGAATLTGLLQGNGTSAITGVTGTAGQFPYYNGTNTLSATSSIFLATNGNVGIGTVSPAAKLDVGTPNTGDTAYEVRITGATQSVLNGHGNLTIQSSDAQGIDKGGSLVFGGHNVDATTEARNWAGIAGLKANAVSTHQGGYLAFYTAQNGVATVPERMRINHDGNVGIGTASPSYQLTLSTDSAGKPTTNTWTISSDSRIKKDVNNFTDGLNTILNIRPVTYKYNGAGGKGYDDTNTHIGIIAQEVEPVAPYMVETGKGLINGVEVNDFKSYQGHALPFIIVNAIKEQQQQIDELRAQIAELKGLKNACYAN